MFAASSHRDRDALTLEEVDRPEAGPSAVVVAAKTADIAYGVFTRAQRLFRYSRVLDCWRLVAARGCTHSDSRQILDWLVSGISRSMTSSRTERSRQMSVLPSAWCPGRPSQGDGRR